MKKLRNFKNLLINSQYLKVDFYQLSAIPKNQKFNDLHSF